MNFYKRGKKTPVNSSMEWALACKFKAKYKLPRKK